MGKIARITNDGKLLIKGELIELDTTTNIDLDGILRGWYSGYTVNPETPNVYYVKGSMGNLMGNFMFSQTIFEVGETYVLSFKIIKTSGDILSIGGHAQSFESMEVYLDDELIGNNWMAGLRDTYPNDNLEHIYRVLLTFTDTAKDSNLYIQLNRDNSYSTEYTAEIYDLKLEKVEDEKVSFKPNGDLIIYGKFVEKVVPLPPEDEIWIYGTFTTTYEIGQLLGDWGSNSRVVDFYYDDDHYVIKASGTNLGETFCRVFNTNGNTVIFGSQFSLTAAFHQASRATFIILNNTLAIRTQNHYMQAKKIYVPDNLVETYKAQTSAMALIGEVLPLSNYTAVMPRITPDGTLVLGELIEGWLDIPTDNLALHLDASTLDLAVGTEILQWDDISGNANHATQNTKTKQPIFTSINNSPSVYFDGIDDTMVSNITSTNDFTIIGAVNVVDGGGVFQWANREKSGFPYVYRRRNSVNSQQWYINTNYRIVENIDDGETHVFTLTRNDATEHWKSYVNGSETGNYVGGIGHKYEDNVFWIGQGYHGFTKAYWHELLIYDRPLTDTERQKVEEYLMAKWLIQT